MDHNGTEKSAKALSALFVTRADIRLANVEAFAPAFALAFAPAFAPALCARELHLVTGSSSTNHNRNGSRVGSL